MSKPWDNEPTPLTKKAIIDSRGQWSFELRDAMANLERRVRAAERLINIGGRWDGGYDWERWKRECREHIEAVEKEDAK